MHDLQHSVHKVQHAFAPIIHGVDNYVATGAVQQSAGSHLQPLEWSFAA